MCEETAIIVDFGQIFKYFVRDDLCQRRGRKKTLGGVLGGTTGIQKSTILIPPPRRAGPDNKIYAQDGGKKPFFGRKPEFFEEVINKKAIECAQKLLPHIG